MNLQGSVNMITSPSSSNSDDDVEERPVNPESDSDDESGDNDEDEEELAVDIVDSVLLGSGARITCLASWAAPLVRDPEDKEKEEPVRVDKKQRRMEETEESLQKSKKQKRDDKTENNVLDEYKLQKARALVQQAKKIQKRKTKKKQKQQQQQEEVAN